MLHPTRQVLANKDVLCREVLSSLPQWFGIPSAVDTYVDDVAPLPVFAVGADGRDVGFVALRARFDDAIEVYVMGVKPEFHRRGMGRELMDAAENFARTQGYRLMFVKTLGPSRKSEHYAHTRSFYESMGFLPVDELDGVWDEGNPCLIMVKPL